MQNGVKIMLPDYRLLMYSDVEWMKSAAHSTSIDAPVTQRLIPVVCRGV